MQKDIGNYIVYSDGRVWSKHLKRFKKCGINKSGYYFTVLNRRATDRINTTIHRLIAQTFIPNPNNLSAVHHRNNSKLDNRVENLEWISPVDNSKKAKEDGLYPKGENSSCVKLTEEQAKKIKYEHKDLTIRKIGKLYKVHHSQVISIRSGKSWKHV
jgi:hypothetical protein